MCQRYDRRRIIVTLRNDETSHRRRGTFPRAIARQANVASCSERDHALASVLRSQIQREADPAKIDRAVRVADQRFPILGIQISLMQYRVIVCR